MRQVTTGILLIIGLHLFGQQKPAEQPKNKKYIAWFSPSRATEVYGVMFNLFPKDPIFFPKAEYPVIYGSEINLNPLGLFFPYILALYSMAPKTHCPLANSIDSINFEKFKVINGIQIGLINMEPSIINGLDINATGSFESKTNGLTLSLVMNKHYISNGVTFAFFGNHDTECKGIQIGLVNSAVKLKGVQIGLWNKNQKRKQPIINWDLT